MAAELGKEIEEQFVLRVKDPQLATALQAALRSKADDAVPQPQLFFEEGEGAAGGGTVPCGPWQLQQQKLGVLPAGAAPRQLRLMLTGGSSRCPSRERQARALRLCREGVSSHGSEVNTGVPCGAAGAAGPAPYCPGARRRAAALLLA